MASRLSLVLSVVYVDPDGHLRAAAKKTEFIYIILYGQTVFGWGLGDGRTDKKQTHRPEDNVSIMDDELYTCPCCGHTYDGYAQCFCMCSGCQACDPSFKNGDPPRSDQVAEPGSPMRRGTLSTAERTSPEMPTASDQGGASQCEAVSVAGRSTDSDSIQATSVGS